MVSGQIILLFIGFIQSGQVEISGSDYEDYTEEVKKGRGQTSPQKNCRLSRAKENVGKIEKFEDYFDGVGRRIMGGYEVDRSHKRPWVAMVLATKTYVTKLVKNDDMSKCGGSVINRRYIITASHCVCRGPDDIQLPCSESKKDAGRLLYEPSETIMVLLGLNDKETKGKSFKGTDHIYGVEAVKQNPWFRTAKAPNDYALIKVDREIKFRHNFIMPIALPTKSDDKDLELAEKSISENRVYSAGWGRIKVSNKICTTDKNGPVKYAKCSYDPDREKRPKCFGKDTPSMKNEMCRHFKETQGDTYPMELKEHIRIVDKQTKNDSFCFSINKGPFGWCRTLIKGQNGENWGWCDHISCNTERKHSLGRKLQEVRVMMLSKKDCNYFEEWNKNVHSVELFYDAKTELCTGRIRNFTKVVTYIKDGEKYENPRHLKTEDKFGLEKLGYKLNYYLGGQDTCHGDSGGSLYAWFDGVPTLMGIVSRGTGKSHDEDRNDGCAEYNFPGVYCRVSNIIKWVRENAEDGNC